MRRGLAIIVSLLLPATTLAAAPTTEYRCTTINTCAVAKQVVLDAGYNNPLVGNEWQFFGVKNVASNGGYVHNAAVQNGEELALRIYIDNNASPKRVSPSIVRDVKVHVAIPTHATNSLNLHSSIVASNSTPQKISDTLQLTAAQPFILKEVSKSATLQWADANVSNGITTSINDSVVAGGAAIGKIKAGYRNSVVLTVLVRVHMVSGSQTAGLTGGTPAPAIAATPNSAPAAPATSPVATTPATPSPQPAATPAVSSSAQSPTTPAATTPIGRISNVTITPNPDTSSTTSQSGTADQTKQSQAPGQAQPQAQTTTLPDTGATSATSGTAGLALIIIGLAIYHRSRQSLARRLRRAV